MSYQKAGKFARSAGVKEYSLSPREFDYLTELIGAQLVTVDGDKVIVGVDGQVNQVYIPRSGGGIKSLDIEMPRKYGYSKGREAGDVTYFGCYVQPGCIGGNQEDSERGHVWSLKEIYELMGTFNIYQTGVDESCRCESCVRQREDAVSEFCRLGRDYRGLIPPIPVFREQSTERFEYSYDGGSIFYSVPQLRNNLMSPHEAMGRCAGALREYLGLPNEPMDYAACLPNPNAPLETQGKLGMRELERRGPAQLVAEHITYMLIPGPSLFRDMVEGKIRLGFMTCYGVIYHYKWFNISPTKREWVANVLAKNARQQWDAGWPVLKMDYDVDLLDVLLPKTNPQ